MHEANGTFCAATCYAGTMWIQTADADVPARRRSLGRIAGVSISAICGGHEEARIRQPSWRGNSS